MSEAYYKSLSIAQAEKIEQVQRQLDKANAQLVTSIDLLRDQQAEIVTLQTALRFADARINRMLREQGKC